MADDTAAYERVIPRCGNAHPAPIPPEVGEPARKTSPDPLPRKRSIVL